MTGKDEDRNGNDTLQMVTSLVVGLFVVIIGIPLWWKTTTTYRAHLPHNDIHALAQQKLTCNIPVVLVSCYQQFPDEQLKLTGKVFKDILQKDTSKSLSNFQLKYTVASRSCTQKELSIIKSDMKFEELDEALGLVDGIPSEFPQIFLLPESLSRKSSVYAGKYNTIYTTVETPVSDLQQVLEKVSKIFQRTVLNVDSLVSTYITSRGVKINKVDPDTVRALQSTPVYQLSFSLMNSDPGETVARWNIEQAVEDYLKPFLDRLKVLADFLVSSQVLHYSDLPVNPRRAKDGSHYYLSALSLPLLINPVETKIGSDVSMYPTLNFLVYIPSMRYTPLHIVDKKGNKVDTNAFFSPRWGGIQVQNPPPQGGNATRPAEYTVDLRSAMEVYLSQMRLLMGIPNQGSSEEVTIAKPGQQAVTEWELQTLLRKRAVENIATATNTLYSLSRLLEQINNMVINDEVAAEVYRAVESLREAHAALAEGQLLEAFNSSKSSTVSSEKAFFDPSLLELLYFPEDQKFAIYIPLFLPIGLPVAASLYKALKWMKAKRKEKQS